MEQDKIIQELQSYIDKVHLEMSELKSRASKPYLEIFKKYNNELDFDRYNLEVNVSVYNSYTEYTIAINEPSLDNVFYWGSDKVLCKISVGKNGEIDGIDLNSPNSIDFNRYNERVEWILYSKIIGAQLVQICHENRTKISHDLTKLSLTNSLELCTEKINAAQHMLGFANNLVKFKLSDKIWKENKIKISDFNLGGIKIGVPGFGTNNRVYIDELEFSRNKTGTYTVSLKNNGEVISHSKRCGDYYLEDIINTITTNMNGWDREYFKDL